MALSQASAQDVQLVTADTNASHHKAIKTIVLHRTCNSFGFTLRRLVVYPPEVIRPEFPNEARGVNGVSKEPIRGQHIDTLFVRQVSPNGPADKAGLSSGDQVVSVNGIQTLNKSYKQVIEIIQKSQESVELGIIPKEDCMLVSPLMTVCKKAKPNTPETENPPSITSSLKMPPSDNHCSQNSTALTVNLCDPSENEPIIRRSSSDRCAQENRNYVVSSKVKDEINNNADKNKKSNQPSIGSTSSGTYFFATTDYSGKPKALHFQRGTNMDQLEVVGQGKARSKSLSSGELEGLKSWGERHKYYTPQHNVRKVSSPNKSSSLEININQPDKKPSRVISSDSPSTVNVSTNSEVISRQPIAREHKQNSDESSSFLVKTISSHMNHERRSSGFQSSTVSATLLESQPTKENNNEPQQTSQLSIYTNQSPQQHANMDTHDDVPVNAKKQRLFEEREQKTEQCSPRHRRTSYLMATNSSNRPQPANNGSTINKTPSSSSTVLQSTCMTPMTAHASSNEEKNLQKNDTPMEDDEIFVENETGLETAPRLGRRISYVMATSSSPSSPRVTLDEMKEEEEQPPEVSVMMEVIKEGFLWKKLVVGGGGKRSSIRSWKTVYCVLRGHVLYFHKDRDSAHQTKMGESAEEQQPISIKSCIVDIAHDYTKRKNVFRLTTFNGCEYLFQCEDRSSMMKWIEAMQSNNNPDEDESGVTSQSLIIRRMRNVEQESTGTSHSGNKLTPNASSAKMPNFSNLKKSLSFKNISGTQSKEESNKSNKWNKSSKKRKKQPSNLVNYVQGHSIGVPLEMCPMSKENKCVPVLVEHCCQVIDSKGVDSVGVYRVPGNSAAVSLLQDEVNHKGAESVGFDQEKWHDVNNITSLLKQFLRKLPEGLLTADLYEGFIEANKKEDPVDRMWALKCLINELPESNFETLKFLLAHLKRISDNAETNKMEARNLAIVFGPTLVRTGEDTMISMVKDMSDQCRIVETLLTHNDWFFEESGDGEEPPSKPPVSSGGQDHFVSMSVLSSLGQAAGNFGEDGNMKAKPGGGLSQISLHIPKFRGKPSKSESHDSSSPDPVMSDGSASPTLDRGALPHRAAAGSCPGSPTMDRHRLAPKRNSELTSLSTGSITPALESSDDSKIRGSSSLKAYSYSRPPPPSYRKSGPPRGSGNQTSETGADTLPVFVTFSGSTTPESEIPPKFDFENDVDSQPSKPSFASLSEETRLRLLKVSLHQKAMEKKRQSESSSPGMSPPPPSRFDRSEFGSTEHLSSSNTSRSSSTPSSKTASLDSLTQSTIDIPESRKVYPARVIASSVGRKSAPAESTVTPKSTVTTSEIITVVQGNNTQAMSGTAKRRPSSSDIRARRNTAEGLRVRPSMQSESSDSSSEDEAIEVEENMSQTFNEKLRILLDVNQPINKNDKKSDEMSSLSKEDKGNRRPSVDNRERRPSDSHSERLGKTSESACPSTKEISSNAFSPSYSERRPSLNTNQEGHRRASVDVTETRTTIEIEPISRDRHSTPVINTDQPVRKTSLTDSERLSTGLQPMMSRVRTTTPVALKEFKIASATFRKDLAAAGQRSHNRKPIHKDSPIVKAKTEESSITISPRNSYGSLARSPRTSISNTASPRNSFGESPRNSRSEVNINLSRNLKPVAGDKKAVSTGTTERKRHPETEKIPKEEGLVLQKGQAKPRDREVERKSSGGSNTSSQTDLKQNERKNTPPWERQERKHQPNRRERKASPLFEHKASSVEERKSILQSGRKSTAQSERRTQQDTESKNIAQSDRKSSIGAERKPSSKYSAMAARQHHVQPKVMSRDTDTKPRAFPRDGGHHRDILPSKGRNTFKEHGKEKLETNAQHIAELLEEMHSERLKMMRQRSDISGQAQKAAAQRAALRRRRRSVGDENEPNSPKVETDDCVETDKIAANVEQPDSTSHYYKMYPGYSKKSKNNRKS